MSLREWIDRMLGRRQNHIDEGARVVLDQAENQMAGRLSKLTGKRRDDVLAEAYRRADRILTDKPR